MRLAATLWRRVANDGLLILVEPATPHGFSTVKKIRDSILELNKNTCSVVAPCPHSLKCPAEYCFFQQRVEQSKLLPHRSRRLENDVVDYCFLSRQLMMNSCLSRGYSLERYSFVVLQKKRSSVPSVTDDSILPEDSEIQATHNDHSSSGRVSSIYNV